MGALRFLAEALGDLLEHWGTGISRAQLHRTIRELSDRNSELLAEVRSLRREPAGGLFPCWRCGERSADAPGSLCGDCYAELARILGA